MRRNDGAPRSDCKIGRCWQNVLSDYRSGMPLIPLGRKYGVHHTNILRFFQVLKPDHPHSDTRGYVNEAVLVLEAKLGRSLERNELAHHINRNRADNRPENLQLMTRSEHGRLHGMEGAMKRWYGMSICEFGKKSRVVG